MTKAFIGIRCTMSGNLISSREMNNSESSSQAEKLLCSVSSTVVSAAVSSAMIQEASSARTEACSEREHVREHLGSIVVQDQSERVSSSLYRTKVCSA